LERARGVYCNIMAERTAPEKQKKIWGCLLLKNVKNGNLKGGMYYETTYHFKN